MSEQVTRRPLVRRMVARDSGESHRASTNLELLFDLTFVVAVAQIAAQLAHSLAAGHVGHGLLSYAMVFFAIWWAWVNFTWFASAFDTDDVPYRLLTLLQMGGVLVLAAGVPGAFAHSNFDVVVVGYVIMRVAMIIQWLRAARGSQEYRITCVRYAAGIALVQVLWLLRLAVPAGLAVASFLVLAAMEVSIPWWAERRGMTSWHPEHISERYGLFTIIVLGECVSQATVAVQHAFQNGGLDLALGTIAASGLVLLFGLWWLYFLDPVADELRDRPRSAFVFGYGHYLVFGALAAVAAGLEVAVEADAATDHFGLSDTGVALAIAVPVAVFLIVFGALDLVITGGRRPPPSHLAVAAVLVIAAAFSARAAALPVAVLLICVPVIALVADGVLSPPRTAASK